MAIYRYKNFSRGRLSNLEASNGDVFEHCNFSRSVPHTVILTGITGLTFTQCNLVNCDVPGDAVIDGGLHIHKELCAHLHPNRVDAGEIDAEDDNCSHVVDTDEVWIDGELVDTIYHYKDTVV